MSYKIYTPLTRIVYQSTQHYLESLNGESRKHNGQFFTPPGIAAFMSELPDYNSEFLSILDPGAGTGILTASICDKIIKQKKTKRVRIDLFENDERVIPFLEKNINLIKIRLKEYDIYSNITLYKKDFIAENAHLIDESLFANDIVPQYDIVISNPPYFKIAKDSYHAKLMSKIVHGQPNIYPFFMALSAMLLKRNGQLIFITPRSYCSGLYFRI
ncbi:MAG: N-6 DNA methylase, partial [Calditrichaeota bacterium]|nr:N-6 DNA methylase [Calditrichota bacterium]